MGYSFYKGMKDLAKKPTAIQTAYMELVAQIKRKFKNIGKRGYVPIDNVYKDETPKRVLKKDLAKLEDIAKNIYQFAKYYNPLTDKYIIGTERRRQERAEAARKGWETRRANEAKRRAEEIEREQREKGYDNGGVNEDDLKKRARKQAEDEQGLPRETEVVFKQIEDMINNWSPSSLWSEELKRIKTNDRNTLKSVLDGAISSLGREQVIRNCIGNEYELIGIVQRILYTSGSTYKDYSAREGVQIDIQKFTEILYGRPLTVAESKDITDMMERMNEGE